MSAGIVCLVLGYVLSQFYRAFLAVLAPALAADIGADAAALARASGWWFVTFAAMQLPVGWALDRIGPRRTAAGLLAGAGGAGAVLFALAQSPVQVELAMALIGIGCSPMLMAPSYIFARTAPAALFGTLAGVVIGVGTLGNLAAALPLALLVEAAGWRGAMALMAGLTLAAAAGVAFTVRDPPPAVAAAGAGGLGTVLRDPLFWPVLAMMAACYAPSAAVRGLWAGPYLSDVHGAALATVGWVTLAMGAAMVAGSFAQGPAERVLRSRKRVVLWGNLAGVLCFALLWWNPAPGFWVAAVLVVAVGLFGTSYPVVMAHGRAFFPPHLAGRGVTLLNLFGIGGAGLVQLATGPVHGGGPGAAGYGALFGFLALILAAGCAAYALARDRMD